MVERVVNPRVALLSTERSVNSKQKTPNSSGVAIANQDRRPTSLFLSRLIDTFYLHIKEIPHDRHKPIRKTDVQTDQETR